MFIFIKSERVNDEQCKCNAMQCIAVVIQVENIVNGLLENGAAAVVEMAHLTTRQKQ